MIVTFCGHRDEFCNNEIKERLYIETERLINRGAKKFFLGGYGFFDLSAATTVKKLKEKYPHIEAVIILPYINKKYPEDLYDYSIYPSIEKALPRFAITERNKWMIENSDVLIALVKKSYGGAYNTLRLAQKKQKEIIYI